MALPAVSGEFRVVADPELRFTNGGMAVGRVRLVASSRKKEGDEWVDDKTLWIDGTCFKQMAENVAESLRKGDLVVVVGKLVTDEWVTDGGEKRSKISLTIDEIGPTLRFRSVLHSDGQGGKVTREGASDSPADNDPWATPPPDDQPPF